MSKKLPSVNLDTSWDMPDRVVTHVVMKASSSANQMHRMGGCETIVNEGPLALTANSKAKGLVIGGQCVGGDDVSKSDPHQQVELSPVQHVVPQTSEGLLVIELPKLFWLFLCSSFL